MKVLSVKNPWAYMIMHHGKDVENRSIKTNFRGRVLIHASKNPDEVLYNYTFGFREFGKILDEVKSKRAEIDKLNGHIIGSVEIYNCTRPYFTMIENPSMWGEMEAGWHWWLRNPVMFPEPIPAKGMLGFWEYEGDGLIC